MRKWSMGVFFLPLALPLFLLFVSEADARRSRKISLSEPVGLELNRVLEVANQLHGALVRESESGVQESIDNMMAQLEVAEEAVSRSSDFRRRHIIEVLRSIRNSVDLSKRYSGYRRNETLRSVFDGVVQIATNYKLKSYRLFYCSEDRAVWLQKSWTAKHPFDRESLKSCGLAIH